MGRRAQRWRREQPMAKSWTFIDLHQGSRLGGQGLVRLLPHELRPRAMGSRVEQAKSRTGPTPSRRARSRRSSTVRYSRGSPDTPTPRRGGEGRHPNGPASPRSPHAREPCDRVPRPSDGSPGGRLHASRCPEPRPATSAARRVLVIQPQVHRHAVMAPLRYRSHSSRRPRHRADQHERAGVGRWRPWTRRRCSRPSGLAW